MAQKDSAGVRRASAVDDQEEKAKATNASLLENEKSNPTPLYQASMPPSPPPSPSQRAALPSKEEMNKRRSIYAELSNYIDDLKTSSSSRPGTSQGPQSDDEGSTGVSFPSNFDEVVSCMTRADLTVGVGDGGEVEGGTAAPFSNGPPTDASVDWSKYALSDGISKLGVYYQYEQELKRDQSDRDRIEKAMAKVQMLDRKIGIKEVEHGARLEEYKREVDELQLEVDRFSKEYRENNGVAPPGSKHKSPDGKTAGLDVPEAGRYYGSGPPSSRSSTSTRGGRVFLTDKMREATPRSARYRQRSDLVSPAGSDVSELNGLKVRRPV